MGEVRFDLGKRVIMTAAGILFRGSGTFDGNMLIMMHRSWALDLVTSVQTHPYATARKMLQSKGGKHQNGNQSIHKSTPI
ncbi:MAG: hypothetical protein U0941_18530 [Planctomycetaceae bacterium]